MLVAAALLLGVIGAGVALIDHAASAQPGDDALADGELLWKRDCVSCHGQHGEGTGAGPSLQGMGTAGIDFVLRTGRMPLERDLERLADPGALDAREQQLLGDSEPKYTETQIRALVEHTAGFVDGPPVPELDLDAPNMPRGFELFKLNCAACHAWSGVGGALTSGKVGPSLHGSRPQEVADAVRYGPGTMPNFAEQTIDEDDLASIVAYVDLLQSPRDEGGHGLAHLGPVAEGAAAWAVGIVGLLLVARWIGRRSVEPEDPEGGGEHG